MNEKKNIVINETDMNFKFNSMVQLLLEGFLKKKKLPDLKTSLNKANLEYKPGLLYVFHIELVQLMLQEELFLLGINLKDEVEKSGEKFQNGKLSELEKKYLTNKVNNLSGVMLFIQEKENNKHDEPIDEVN